jgi:hypothetical protein
LQVRVLAAFAPPIEAVWYLLLACGLRCEIRSLVLVCKVLGLSSQALRRAIGRPWCCYASDGALEALERISPARFLEHLRGESSSRVRLTSGYSG